MQATQFSLLAAAALCPPTALARPQSLTPLPGPVPPATEGVLTVDGVTFDSWGAYLTSPLFRERGSRCGSAERDPLRFQNTFQPPSDCGYSSTNPSAAYDPGDVLRIQVVVHVIQRTSGTGFVSAADVQGQIDILNEDFRAMAGSNGANGFDCGIEFFLATEDPSGNPTTGITYSTNNTWYDDSGNYWNTLAWDTDRYLNIYTNSADGYLGYVPDLPQGGIVGSNADRVVCLWSSFGPDAPIGPPYDQGRTATHEVGHYLGLYHTFDGGCGSSSACYTTGDLICDTNRESSPHFDCDTGGSSCGSLDPIDNYMDYSDDLCMERFTHEQARRMRCTLQYWRPEVYTVDDGGPDTLGTVYCDPAVINSSGFPGELAVTGSALVADDDLVLSATQLPLGANIGYFMMGTGTNVSTPPGSAGPICITPGLVRLLPPVSNTNELPGGFSRTVGTSGPQTAVIGAGSTWNFQAWHRDFLAGASNLTNAVSVTFQ